MAPGGSISQKDPELAILYTTGCARVLPLGTYALVALLQETRSVDYQHRIFIAQVLDNILSEVIPHQVGVPQRVVEQALYAIWVALSCLFSQLPAILAFDWAEQPLQVC